MLISIWGIKYGTHVNYVFASSYYFPHKLILALYKFYKLSIILVESLNEKVKIPCKSSIHKGFLVPRPGVEPGWITPLVFETSASTDSAIWACVCGCKYTASFGFDQRIERLFLLWLFLFFDITFESCLSETRPFSSINRGSGP